MIGDSQDIHCAICGRYLFTEKDGFCPSRPNSPTGMLVRENDHEDYTWRIITDDFICDQCMQNEKA